MLVSVQWVLATMIHAYYNGINKQFFKFNLSDIAFAFRDIAFVYNSDFALEGWLSC